MKASTKKQLVKHLDRIMEADNEPQKCYYSVSFYNICQD